MNILKYFAFALNLFSASPLLLGIHIGCVCVCECFQSERFSFTYPEAIDCSLTFTTTAMTNTTNWDILKAQAFIPSCDVNYSL